MRRQTSEFDAFDKVDRTFDFFVASSFDFLVTKSNVLNDYTDVNINESRDDAQSYFLIKNHFSFSFIYIYIYRI